MIIGLDLSVLQTPHRMRGIGAVAKEFVNNISEDDKKNNKFVFYLFDTDQNLALETLNLSKIDYEIRVIKKYNPVSLKLPWKFKKLNGIANGFRDIYIAKFGENKIKIKSDLDVFIQFDQMVALPKLNKHTKQIVIIYDIIPYILKEDYLWDYKIARKNGRGILSALRCEYLRKIYKLKLKANCQKADTLIAISKYTKKDFIKHMNVPSYKIKVVYLGAENPSSYENSTYPIFKNYTENSWGYIQKNIDLKSKPFLLFIGGIDPRRKIKDLVAAYNILKAQGNDIRLVLAGDVMISPNNFPGLETRKYISESSYIEDIIFLGYINDEQKKWLYKNTIAFVYPSIYEGFGLPILEAATLGATVLTYNNTSLRELCVNEEILYPNNYLEVSFIVSKLLDKNKSANINKSYVISDKFNWERMCREVLNYG